MQTHRNNYLNLAIRLTAMSIMVATSATNALAAPATTSFTYQGKLNQSGQPADGTYNFIFRLFDDSIVGNQIGGDVFVPGVTVANGIFTVTLNAGGEFGAAAFNGSARWLEITVGATLLTPRQPLTAAPYAARALSAPNGFALDAPDGSPTNALVVDNSGNIGIGAPTPGSKLHLAGAMKIDAANTLEFGAGVAKETSAGKIGYQTFTTGALDIVGAGTVVANRRIKFWSEGGAEFNGTVQMTGFKLTTGAAAGRLLTSDANGIGTWQSQSAITPQPALDAWGSNIDGALNCPTGVFTKITAGWTHNVAIRADGTLAGWGTNNSGQINVPTGTFTAVAAGDIFSVGIRTDGTLVGWGNNGFGQINVPAGTFTAVAAGRRFGVAIRTDGTLASWGSNAFGQQNIPPGTFTAVAAGTSHGLAIRSDGTLAAWGLNTSGQANVPPGTFIAVAGGDVCSIAIRSDGTLAGWGDNTNGQLSLPSGTFTSVAAGTYHALAIRTDSTVATWGNDNIAGAVSSNPGGVGVTSIAAGLYHSLAIRTAVSFDGRLNMFGPLKVAGNAEFTGRVGIGTSAPSQALQVIGNICATGTIGVCSDARFKKNVLALTDALDRVAHLRGVTFEWKREEFADHHFADGRQVGFIAQEVEEVLPEIVARGTDGYRSVDYGRLTPLLVEAIKDLNRENTELKARLDKLEQSLEHSTHTNSGGAR